MQAMGLGEVAADFMGLWSALSAVLLMLVVVLLSLYLSLGIHRDAVIATIRYAASLNEIATHAPLMASMPTETGVGCCPGCGLLKHVEQQAERRVGSLPWCLGIREPTRESLLEI